MQSDRHARISERAYQIWLAEGRVHGKHVEHWHRAEREIAAEEAKPSSRARPRASAAASGAASPARGGRARATAATPSEATPATVSRSRAKAEEAAEKPKRATGRRKTAPTKPAAT